MGSERGAHTVLALDIDLWLSLSPSGFSVRNLLGLVLEWIQ